MDAAATRPSFSWWKLARTFVGLMLAPAVGGALGVTLAMLPEMFGSYSEFADIPGMLWFGFAFGFILGALPALIIGWPLHLFLLRQRWTSLWVYVGLGALLGVAAMFITPAFFEVMGW